LRKIQSNAIVIIKTLHLAPNTNHNQSCFFQFRNFDGQINTDLQLVLIHALPVNHTVIPNLHMLRQQLLDSS